MGRMMSVDEKISAMARAINRQIGKLAMLEMRKTRNVWITEDGRILEIRNHMDLNNAVEDNRKRLDDMLRQLDGLLKERDGV